MKLRGIVVGMSFLGSVGLAAAMPAAALAADHLAFGETTSGSAPSGSVVVNRGFPCDMGPVGVSTNSFEVQTGGGFALLTCYATKRNPSGPITITGQPCGTSNGITTNMRFTWSAAGQASLVCIKSSR